MEVCLTVEHANKHVQDILSIVGKVKSTEIRSPTLDDVFIHYTEEECEKAPGRRVG